MNGYIPFFLSKNYNQTHIDVNFLDYNDFIDQYSDVNQGVFIFNTAIINSDDLWVLSLAAWKNQYLK